MISTICTAGQPLLYADFCWIDNVNNFSVINVALYSSTNYVFKVNLEYSQYLQDAHSDLLFCPMQKSLGKGERRSFSRHYMIKSITSYIIAISRLSVSALQRSIVYCNLRNLYGFASTSKLIQILELVPEKLIQINEKCDFWQNHGECA